jgi:hypothetical protein
MSLATLQNLLNEIERRKGKALGFDPAPYSFGPQIKFVKDQSQFVGALTTRRAGKSNGLALKYFSKGLAHKGVLLPYLALTRDSAKNIMWPVLQEQAEICKVRVNFTESNLTAELIDTGSSIRLYGADMKNFIRRLRGMKTPFAGVDEAGEFGSHLTSLIDDVLTPCISDYADGQIALTGTPGPVPFVYFFDVTEMAKYGYSVHRWSLFDNPFMPNPREFVAKLKAKKGWTDENPTYLREWCGKWVKDMDVLVFKYDPETNHPATVPKTTEHVIAIDIGFHDADAIAVIGWKKHDTKSYLVKEDVQRKQGITELAEKIGRYINEYKPMSVVMDTGGLGAKIAEELRRRYRLPIKAAEKTRKFEYIELLNDAMRGQRFYAASNSLFAEDSMRVQWDKDRLAPDRLVVSDKFHSDICDAVLYGFRESLSWLEDAEPKKEPYRSDAWFKEEEERLFQLAVNKSRKNNDDEDEEKTNFDNPWGETQW